MPSPKRSTFILILFTFGSLLFLVGTVLFFKNHYENVQLKTALETEGILTTGYVSSKYKDTKRRVAASDFKWQYSTDYSLEYHYIHDGQAGKDRFAFSLEDYLDKDSSSQTPPTTSKLENLGKITLQSTVDETLFDRVEPGSALSIVYLYQQPASARILYPDNQLSIPKLQFFAWACLFLALSSMGILWSYWKTGKTI